MVEFDNFYLFQIEVGLKSQPTISFTHKTSTEVNENQQSTFIKTNFAAYY